MPDAVTPDTWASFIKTQGLAITLVLFFMVVIVPALGYGIRAVWVWVRDSGNEIKDSHLQLVKKLSSTQESIVGQVSQVAQLLSTYHTQGSDKLTEIRNGIQTLNNNLQGRPEIPAKPEATTPEEPF